MAKVDKFKNMQQGGGALSSFQELATTVAAIEKQAEPEILPKSTPADNLPKSDGVNNKTNETGLSKEDRTTIAQQRYVRLPNPQIPVSEYNLVSAYCNSFTNMTRQDFVELAILEKLHNDGQITDEEYQARHNEVCSRPPRGQRKGTKTQTSK